MADDISKLCSDYLRQRYPGLKASHSRELVAAFWGYKSHAALLCEQTYKIDALYEVAMLLPAVSLINHRLTCLEGLSKTVESGAKVTEAIVAFLRDKELFTGEVWICDDIGAFMIEEYLPEKLSGELDTYLAEPITETNAYFADHEYKKAEVDDGCASLTVKVTGTFYGEMDLDKDRMFCGDTIDFVATIELYRIAGRIGFMEPEIDAVGSVRRDYYDDEPDEDGLKIRSLPPSLDEKNIDIEVAKHVMGWKYFSKDECVAHPGHSHWELNEREGNIPAYSTDPDAAQEIVNVLSNQGLVFSQIKGGVSFHKDLVSYESLNRNLSRAICEAALLSAGKIDPQSSPFNHLVRTWGDDHDGYGIYRIKHYVNGKLVDWVSAGEPEHRLRHAVEYWHLTLQLRSKVRTWLDAYQPSRRSPEMSQRAVVVHETELESINDTLLQL